MTDTHGDPSSSTDTARVGIKTSLLGAEKVAERIDETDQLNERSVGQTIGQGISPPYPPEQLTSLLELNGTVATGVQKKSRREVGFGFDIVGHDRVSDPAPEQRERVADFWYGPDTIWKVGPTGTPTASPIEVLQKARKDFHTVGWLALELLYAGADTELVGMAHLPAATVRLKRHEDADDDERKAGHGFVQELDGQTRYFAEAGDRHNTTLDGDPNPIYVDKEDGEVVEGEPPEDVQPANELLFVRNNHPNTIYYGLPDHIAELQTIVADQQARDFNRKFFEYDAIPAYLFIVEGGTLSESEREDLRGIISQLRNKEGRRAAIIEAEELADSDFGSGDVSIRVEQLTQQGEEDMSFESFRRHNERTIASALEVHSPAATVPTAYEHKHTRSERNSSTGTCSPRVQWRCDRPPARGRRYAQLQRYEHRTEQQKRCNSIARRVRCEYQHAEFVQRCDDGHAYDRPLVWVTEYRHGRPDSDPERDQSKPAHTRG